MKLDVPRGQLVETDAGQLDIRWQREGRARRALFEVADDGERAVLDTIAYFDGENWIQIKAPEVGDLPPGYREILVARGYELLEPQPRA